MIVFEEFGISYRRYREFALPILVAWVTDCVWADTGAVVRRTDELNTGRLITIALQRHENI
jgi:hypothetical protein